MTQTIASRIVPQEELIELQAKIESERPGIWPCDLLTRLCAHYLGAAFPKHAELMIDTYRFTVARNFGIELLSANGLDRVARLSASEEAQREDYGGMEALLFEKVTDDLLAFYEKKLDQDPNKNKFDPATCPADEM
jgi:hypothetical protein